MRLARESLKSMNYVALAFSCACMLFSGIVQAARESTRGYDADLTLFSPEGRLYQVEYVMRAVGRYGCPMVGVHGETCCVVACKRDLPDDLVYPDSVTNIFRITDDMYIIATGMSGDVRYQVKRARLQALEYKRQFGSSISSRLLAVTMADAAQVNTQHAAMRPMACVSLLISVDDLSGPLLMRIEPSGQVFQAWGSAAGRGSATSLEFLEKAYEAARREREDVESPAPNGEINESFGNEFGVRKSQGSKGGRDYGMDGGGEESGESPKESDRGKSLIGFGVVGEEETVQLALRALSKASLGKDSDPLSPDNVEIAVASRDQGIRVCSRTEVRGFLGRMAGSTGLAPKFGR